MNVWKHSISIRVSALTLIYLILWILLNLYWQIISLRNYFILYGFLVDHTCSKNHQGSPRNLYLSRCLTLVGISKSIYNLDANRILIFLTCIDFIIINKDRLS